MPCANQSPGEKPPVNKAFVKIVKKSVAPCFLSFAFLLAILFVSALSSRPAFAAGEAIALPAFGPSENLILYIAAAFGAISVLAGLMWRAKVMALSPGTQGMQEVGNAIRAGAYAYLQRQIKAMLPLVVVIAITLFLLFQNQPGYTVTLALGVAVAFLLGVAASYGAGYVGMGVAVNGNQRVAHQARTSFKGAHEAAFQSGAVAGMMTVGLGLLGAALIFLVFQNKAMFVLVGFGFGGSLAALFMRVGGGIFTKAADVGADLVGKVEAGIPEDDPRNPATIADNVGDNVGDCAGMAADVFESYEVTLVAAIILGAAVGGPNVLALALFPLLMQAFGVVASIVGVLTVKGQEKADFNPMQPISFGFTTASIVGLLLTAGGAFYMFGAGITVDGVTWEWWRFLLCALIGVILALVIGRMTEYYTSSEKKPVTEITLAAKTGPATMIISGFAIGLESAVWGVVAIVLALMAAVAVFPGAPLLAAYGVALAGLGLLTTTGYILAMDTFGPITDNANGIFEMSGVLEEDEADANFKPGVLPGDRIVAHLDAVGNTTKALTKGFAIATAVIAAVALFRSFMADADLLDIGIRLDTPEVFMGLLIGGAAPFLFSAFAINAVGRSAVELITEVRRQFREDAGIMAGTSKPDYARCVAIVTAAAQRELLGPGVLAIALPIAVGFGFGIAEPQKGALALGGYLAGAIVSGQLMAVLLSNSGGAWDNAKKKIEDGWFGGKGTEQHKASVVCDTVGDPFKDTAGPALNPLIKVMNLVALLIAPIIISTTMSQTVRIVITLVAVGALAGAIMFSKRGSIADDPNAVAEATSAERHGLGGAMEPPSLAHPLHPSDSDAIADDKTMHDVLTDDTVYAEPERK
jgi:K(+)-stimulated pyrophosphate-energized sodium pump